MTHDPNSLNKTLAPWPEDPPGLRLANLVKIANGNMALVKKLLTGFAMSFADADEKIRGSLLKQEREKALREVHSLKGTAGNIGAESLFSAAAALEQQLRSGDFTISGLYYDFQTKFRQVMESVQGILRDEGKAEEDFLQEKPVDQEAFAMLLRELHGYLSNNDARAIGSLEALRDLVAGSSLSVRFAGLAEAVSTLDTEEALAIIEEIVGGKQR
jgi:HPt (histidine-containing phosphotransfer) domain-containing protein